MTRAPEVGALDVSQEHVGAAIDLLRRALQSSRVRREPRQVRIVRNDDQKIDVLWLLAVSSDRSQQANAANARDSRGCSNELDRRLKELVAPTRIRWSCHFCFNPVVRSAV